MLLFLFPDLLFGQVQLSDDFIISMGTPYGVADAVDKEYFPDGSGNSISIKTQGQKVIIQRYNVESMKEINRIEYVDLPVDSKVEKILQAGDQLYYFYSTPTKAKTITLNVRELVIADGTFKTPRLVVETKGDVTPNPSNVNSFAVAQFGGPTGGSSLFEITASSDHSKFLIQYRRKPLIRNDAINYDILGLYSFDTTLEKRWGNEFIMPYTEKAMNKVSYTIGNDGTAYILAFITDTKEFELLTFTGDAAIKKNRLKSDAEVFIQEITMYENAEGNLDCTGYYATDPASVMNINGLLRFKMTKAGTILETHTYVFSPDLINQYEVQRSKKTKENEGKTGIHALKIVAIENNADGSTLIAGEQSYRKMDHTSTGMRTSTTIRSYYADMVVTKVDISGKLLWMIKLPKTQWGERGKGGNGVKFIEDKEYSYLIFLDDKKNAALAKDTVSVPYEDGTAAYLTAYKIDNKTGNYTRHIVFDINNVNEIELQQFSILRFFDISSNIFMIEIYIKDKMDTMIKMQLKN